jgi:hypothetical protein
LNGSRHLANFLVIAGILLLLTLSASGRVVRGRLAANPSPVSFGNTQAGAAASRTVALSNAGETDVTITRATMSGAGFSLNNLSLPLTLQPGTTTSATIMFAPPGSGNYSGSVSLDTVAEDHVTDRIVLSLGGYGVSAEVLIANPLSETFGNVQVGSSANLYETLTNSGGLTITISQADLTGAGFSISGLTLPLALTANQSVTFTATFTPTGAGAASGSLSVVSNASNSPLNIALSGTGTATVQHTVDLSWNASADAVGYNVYRGTVSGGPYSMINASLDGSSAYTDNTVVSGQTYYYVATAVDSGSQESGYSNETQAVIPNP